MPGSPQFRRPFVRLSYPTLYPSGHTSWGSGPRILACGGRLWVLARWSSEAEEVPDCSRLNWWVISNHQPPVKLRAGPQGTGESSSEWGGSEALPPPPGLCAWAGYPTVPRQRGLWGTECCPFCCSICRPQSGRAGNETMAFFLQDLDQNALRSSLLAARDQTGPNRGIPGLLTGRSKARCWWPGSSPYRDA